MISSNIMPYNSDYSTAPKVTDEEDPNATKPPASGPSASNSSYTQTGGASPAPYTPPPNPSVGTPDPGMSAPTTAPTGTAAVAPQAGLTAAPSQPSYAPVPAKTATSYIDPATGQATTTPGTAPVGVPGYASAPLKQNADGSVTTGGPAANTMLGYVGPQGGSFGSGQPVVNGTVTKAVQTPLSPDDPMNPNRQLYMQAAGRDQAGITAALNSGDPYAVQSAVNNLLGAEGSGGAATASNGSGKMLYSDGGISATPQWFASLAPAAQQAIVQRLQSYGPAYGDMIANLQSGVSGQTQTPPPNSAGTGTAVAPPSGSPTVGPSMPAGPTTTDMPQPVPYTPNNPTATPASPTASSTPSNDVLTALQQGVAGQGPGSAVSQATQAAELAQLANPNPYSSDEIQQLYKTQGQDIQDQYSLAQKNLAETMAQRGLGASSINAGQLSDLNVAKRSAQESMAQNLDQMVAQAKLAGTGQAIAQGQSGATSAQNNAQNWLSQLMGYGQNAFNNDVTTQQLNQNQQNSYQNLLLQMLLGGYSGGQTA